VIERRRKPAQPSLPQDSLAYALRQAGKLVEAVLDGRNVTEAFEQAQSANPLWPDGVRGAIRDLTWGCLRDYGRGDLILARLLSRPLPVELHALLLVALYRLETRPAQAHVIVDQAVEAVASFAPGLKAVANGVLRNSQRQLATFAPALEADPRSRYRHPEWWVTRLRKDLPDDWEAALAASNQRPPMSLRVNLRCASVDTVLATLAAADLQARRLANDAILLEQPVPVSRLPGFAEGLVSVQDAGAQWAARWLDAQPGQRVLDACAAPGGKASHILESSDVALLALEMDGRRAGRIRENFARLGLAGDVQVGDARDPSKWWDGRLFDRILADVPCSASGVVRRHPDIKWLRRAEDIKGFASQQREILDALWPTLAPDGRMLYVTCSLFGQENSAQIDSFCGRHEDAERIALEGKPDQQLLPTVEHDGFYYALLRKRP